jgi:predicted amidophosphoribosyltransferase
MNSITIPASMKVPKKYAESGHCCSCGLSLSSDETYICQQCNDEIDRLADETLGNAEDEDATNV